MQTTLRLTTLALGFLVLSTTGCGLFDGGSSHRKGGSAAGARCDVDLEQWKARVKRFKDKKYQTKDEFRQAKNDLMNDLQKLDTDACRRDLRHEVSDLVDEVKQESF